MNRQFRVGFTGHRDKRVKESELDRIRDLYPGALWVHGGAIGFDSQVDMYARKHDIGRCVYTPCYWMHGPKLAPIIRNAEIAANSDILCALWDGREYGGTYDTIKKARKSKLDIILLEPLK